MATTLYKKRTALIVATFFGCGLSPIAPGTIGSLASLIIWIPSVYFLWPLWVKLGLLLALFFIGVWASAYGIAHFGVIDPKPVVIDEVVGQGIPFLIIGASFLEITLAFILFRLFDIVKPWPIKTIERQYPDKWGVMLDDVAAGIVAMALLFIMKALFTYTGCTV